jgi:hypothetical protein
VNGKVIAFAVKETPKSRIQALPESVTRILSYVNDQRQVKNRRCGFPYPVQIPVYYIFLVQVLELKGYVQNLTRTINQEFTGQKCTYHTNDRRFSMNGLLIVRNSMTFPWFKELRRSTISESAGRISAFPAQQFCIRSQRLSSTAVPEHDTGLDGRAPSRTFNMTVMSFGDS